MKIKFEGGDIDKLVKEIDNLKLKEYADKINEVKNFLLFDEIYSMTNGENFDEAYDKLKKIEDFIPKNILKKKMMIIF